MRWKLPRRSRPTRMPVLSPARVELDVFKKINLSCSCSSSSTTRFLVHSVRGSPLFYRMFFFHLFIFHPGVFFFYFSVPAAANKTKRRSSNRKNVKKTNCPCCVDGGNGGGHQQQQESRQRKRVKSESTSTEALVSGDGVSVSNPTKKLVTSNPAATSMASPSSPPARYLKKKLKVFRSSKLSYLLFSPL